VAVTLKDWQPETPDGALVNQQEGNVDDHIQCLCSHLQTSKNALCWSEAAFSISGTISSFNAWMKSRLRSGNDEFLSISTLLWPNNRISHQHGT
jgi:hypothetical protein